MPRKRLAPVAPAVVVPADRNVGGRPPHVPTPANRTLVALAVGEGMERAFIASLLEISETTLRVHYRDELERGDAALTLKVVGTLYAVATDPKHPKCVTSAIWITKNRLGWSSSGSAADDVDPAAEVDADGEPGGVVVELRIGERKIGG